MLCYAKGLSVQRHCQDAALRVFIVEYVTYLVSMEPSRHAGQKFVKNFKKSKIIISEIFKKTKFSLFQGRQNISQSGHFRPIWSLWGENIYIQLSFGHYGTSSVCQRFVNWSCEVEIKFMFFPPQLLKIVTRWRHRLIQVFGASLSP